MLAHLDIRITSWAEITQQKLSKLWHLCSESTTDPATTRNSCDMFCLATDSERVSWFLVFIHCPLGAKWQRLHRPALQHVVQNVTFVKSTRVLNLIFVTSISLEMNSLTQMLSRRFRKWTPATQFVIAAQCTVQMVQKAERTRVSTEQGVPERAESETEN